MEVVTQPTDAQTEIQKNQRILWPWLDLVAILFWSYALVKLFIFDVDVYFVSVTNPEFVWLLNYKFPILLGAVVIAMLVTRRSSLGLSAIYIATHPFIVLLWKIPRFVWNQKSWVFVFAALNAAIGLIRSFRRDFISSTLLLIGVVLIFSTGNQYVLYGVCLVIFALVMLAYALAFIKAFKPSAVFQTYTKVFPAIQNGDFLKIDTSVRDLPIETLTEKQIELRVARLQNVVLYNRMCLFVSKKLRNYQRSGANIAAYILSLMFLLFFTVLSFALINYALFTIDPSLYQFTYSKESFFSFIYYSAGSMFYAANGLVPIGPISQAVQLVQFLCALVLVGILVTVVYALRNECYSHELSEVIDSMRKEGLVAESLLASEFNFDSVESAIEALQKAKAGALGLIVYLTKNLDG
jgi:hypothetical protein